MNKLMVVDDGLVVSVKRVPRNFSFAALGKVTGSTNGNESRVTPALFSLFIEDFKVKRGEYSDLYEAAWRSYGVLGQLELSYIIC